MSELRAHSSTLEAVRGRLVHGRDAVEGLVGDAPTGVDAGEATPLVLAIVSRLLDGAADVSEGLDALAQQVAETQVDLRVTDVAREMDFLRGRAGVR